MNANIDGSIALSAGVGGTLDSGKIKLFETGVPGLDFPGYVHVRVWVDIETNNLCRIVSIGPTLQINAQAKASLDLDVDMTLGVNYDIGQVNFTFPTGGGQGGSFTPGDTRMSIITGKTL